MGGNGADAGEVRAADGEAVAKIGAAGWKVAQEIPSFPTTIVNRAARRVNRGTIKTVVLNAQSGVRFEGILACLRRPPLANADVILLCEADSRLLRSFNREVAAELAAELEMSFAYCPEYKVRRQTEAPPAYLGNAILSRVPLDDVRTIALPDWRNRRNSWLIGQPQGLVAKTVFEGRLVTIVAAHLHSRWHPEGRARQMATLLEGIATCGPTILGGDFNTTTTELTTSVSVAMAALRMGMQPWRFRYPERYEPLFNELAKAGFEIKGANAMGKPTFTFSRVIPPILRPKLDWIALRELATVAGSARVITARESFFSARVSDHDFVMCEAGFRSNEAENADSDR
jgi:endonuclease/exonuclease/phosphatase family metal-dependent hydrolase